MFMRTCHDSSDARILFVLNGEVHHFVLVPFSWLSRKTFEFGITFPRKVFSKIWLRYVEWFISFLNENQFVVKFEFNSPDKYFSVFRKISWTKPKKCQWQLFLTNLTWSPVVTLGKMGHVTRGISFQWFGEVRARCSAWSSRANSGDGLRWVWASVATWGRPGRGHVPTWPPRGLTMDAPVRSRLLNDGRGEEPDFANNFSCYPPHT